MKLRVLGCSGGIGGHLRTTSMLIDSDVLIDAGTGVGDLGIGELTAIDHVFVTHSHIDHIASIPLMVDTVGWLRDRPLTVHAMPATMEILRQHLFNWKIWPDFTQIPDPARPFMRYQALSLGRAVDLGGRKFTPLPANHVVPAVGFQIDSGSASLAFSGDTTTCGEFWEVVNGIGNLRYVVVETALSNRERDIAIASKHLCPSMLAEELGRLRGTPEIYVTHLKPREAELIMQEVIQCAGRYNPRMLEHAQVFEF